MWARASARSRQKQRSRRLSTVSELDQARALFRAFHRREPRGREVAELGASQGPVVALEAGPALSIGYKALGDGKRYYHEFEGSLPRLYVSGDGRQIFMVGGIYRFTGRGFIK